MIFFSAGVSFLVRLIKGSGAAWHAGRERDMERQFTVCSLLRTCIVCRVVLFGKIDRFDLHSLTLQGNFAGRAARRITTSISSSPDF